MTHFIVTKRDGTVIGVYEDQAAALTAVNSALLAKEYRVTKYTDNNKQEELELWPVRYDIYSEGKVISYNAAMSKANLRPGVEYTFVATKFHYKDFVFGN